MRHRLIAVLLPSLTCINTSWAQTGPSHQGSYQQGVAAFQAQDYTAAITFFESSLKNPSQNDQALHNLAICYYKLGEYQKANDYLKELLVQGDSGPTVVYTLAVTEKKLGHLDRAKALFEEVIELDSPKLANAALLQLQRLDPHSPSNSPAQKNWSSNINLGYGFDDSVLNVLDESSTKGDAYIDLSLSTHWRSNTSSSNHWFFNGLGYTTQFFEVEEYDVTLISLGGGRAVSLGGLRARLHADFERSTLGGNDYLASFSYGLRYTQSLKGIGTWHVKYRGKNISSLDPAYDHLAGNSQRFETSLNFKLSRYDRFRLQYRFDADIRGDRVVIDENEALLSFSNLSARRHTLTGAWKHRLPDHYALRASASYRTTQYTTDYALNNVIQVRNDDKFSASAELSKSLSKHWQVTVGYQYGKNSSSIDSFSYDQNTVFMSTDWNF